MPLSGGGDRELLRPVRHVKGQIGNHRGPSGHLNVRNPQPGFDYHWVIRRRNRVARRAILGYEMVTKEHPEEWGDDLDPNIQRGLDSIKEAQDVVLMRIPVEKKLDIRREKQRQAKLALKGAEEDYLDRGERTRGMLGSAAPADSLYYKRSSHDN
jgi:hypothetical protein